MFSEDVPRELTQCITNIFLSVDIINNKHCDFTMGPSLTGASISRPRQFLELPKRFVNKMSLICSLRKSKRNFGEN